MGNEMVMNSEELATMGAEGDVKHHHFELVELRTVEVCVLQ